MILIDSFGWRENLTDGPLADQYGGHFKKLSEGITPTIVLCDVYKSVRREESEQGALLVAAQVQKTRIIHLTDESTFSATELSFTQQLPTADSIVYATSRRERCSVVTSDPRPERLEGVVFRE